MESALKRLPNTNNIDAIVIHDYIGEFPINPQLCQGSFISADLQTYIEKAFIEEDYLKANTFDLIDDYNSAKFSAKPLEIWLTEFNMLDNNNFRIGTWSHGFI
ncbi:MAG: hypothetical protein IPM91_08370 [Bacteroidetes bacterium]|nr:hypothetical protein [Bacteroidota bacterium]